MTDSRSARSETSCVSGGVSLPCAAYGVSGSKKLAESASEVLRSHDLCIMANHGFTAVAADLETALSRAVAAEEAAKRILESE